MSCQIVGTVFVSFPRPGQVIASCQVISSACCVAVFGIILVSQGTKRHPSFGLGITYIVFFATTSRWVQPGQRAQVLMRLSLGYRWRRIAVQSTTKRMLVGGFPRAPFKEPTVPRSNPPFARLSFAKEPTVPCNPPFAGLSFANHL